MEWAIRAAKSKLKNQEGGSRSIIESLNDLNDITMKGHSRVDEVFMRSNDWLNREMKRLGFPRTESGVNCPASPDKSMAEEEEVSQTKDEEGSNKERVRENEEGRVLDSANKNEIDEVREEVNENNTNTHYNLVVQSAVTPKSLVGDENTGRFIVNTPSMVRPKDGPATISSPLSNSRKNSKDNRELTDNWISVYDNHRRDNETKQTPINTNTTKSIRDRSQRRSNMFVPLPSKDPLIVKPINVENKKRAVNTEIPPLPKKPRALVSSATVKDVHVGSKPTRITGGNVFDRLSHNMTESLERRIAERRVASPSRERKFSTSPRRPQRVGASFSGSPTRRRPTTGSANSEHVKNTLKNIFDTHIPTLSKRPKSQQPLQRRASNLLTTNNIPQRKSLIPRIKDKTPVKINLPNPKNSNNATINPPKPDQRKAQDKLSEASPSDKVNLNSNSLSPTSTDLKSSSHDKLTKFQLLSNTSTKIQEKYELKEKLNKRLSEVMRNQQEQQLRKKLEVHRRASQMDDESKRRTKIVFDKSHPSYYIPSKVGENNSILHDLYTTDHKEIISPKLKINREEDEETLPEIDSDSDHDNDVILAPWAEPAKLREQLMIQQEWDIERILGPIPILRIEEIFLSNNSRLQKLSKR